MFAALCRPSERHLYCIVGKWVKRAAGTRSDRIFLPPPKSFAIVAVAVKIHGRSEVRTGQRPKKKEEGNNNKGIHPSIQSFIFRETANEG
jgi:hypothetical protein